MLEAVQFNPALKTDRRDYWNSWLRRYMDRRSLNNRMPARAQPFGQEDRWRGGQGGVCELAGVFLRGAGECGLMIAATVSLFARLQSEPTCPPYGNQSTEACYVACSFLRVISRTLLSSDWTETAGGVTASDSRQQLSLLRGCLKGFQQVADSK